MSNAILAHFCLTITAELNLMKADLAWWVRKFEYQPHLQVVLETSRLIPRLKARINGFNSLLKGTIEKELQGFAPVF